MKTCILVHPNSEVLDFFSLRCHGFSSFGGFKHVHSCSSIEVMLSYFCVPHPSQSVAHPDMSPQKSWIKSHAKVANLKSTRKFRNNLGFTMIYIAFPLVFPCFVANKKRGQTPRPQDSTLAVLGTSAACWCALRAGRCANSGRF